MRKEMFILFPILCGLCLLSASAYADDVMSPPTLVKQSVPHPGHTTLENEPLPDLHQTLNGTAGSSNMDIRSYLRKDGTRVTEYGQKGKVFRIKIQPTGGLPAYYLYRNTAGQFERRLSSGGKPIAVPNWILKEF